MGRRQAVKEKRAPCFCTLVYMYDIVVLVPFFFFAALPSRQPDAEPAGIVSSATQVTTVSIQTTFKQGTNDLGTLVVNLERLQLVQVRQVKVLI